MLLYILHYYQSLLLFKALKEFCKAGGRILISCDLCVISDCDLEKAVTTSVRSSFANSGQICLCGSRILVEDSIYEEFLEKFLARIRDTVKMGPPADATTTMGSVISFDHRNKIEKVLRNAVENEGGTIVLGGGRPTGEWAAAGAFLEPTVITGLAQSCSTVQEEIFGPVVSVQRFHSEEQALEMANGVRFVALYF